MNSLKIYFFIAVVFLPLFSLIANNPEDYGEFLNWQNLDYAKDKKMGVSVEKAYSELLQGKKSKTIVVAVIDGGVDIEHEDLEGNIWVNEDEIPDNGIDDDSNGYVDDVHGWNFIGNTVGENINHAPLEVTRLYRQYNDQLAGLTEDQIDSAVVDLLHYQNVKSTYETEIEENKNAKERYDKIAHKYERYDSVLISMLGEDYGLADLKKFKAERKSLNDSAKKFISGLMKRGITGSYIMEVQDYYANRINYHYNPELCSREIIGDNTSLWSDMYYGNNNVEGPDPTHGTMVSGVICANRNNQIGVNGIADNVKIMSIRTVPDGDEWDKDVAKAIQYAIDNGANVINMSFGKSFSPQKNFIDSVICSADKNNVLLVHAAGNDNENIDIADNFPNKYNSSEEVLANNWLTIGASTISKKKKSLVAEFSNYGLQNVDVFAPGHDMVLCAPNNEYDLASGTSFAAPVVSGVAALIMSYYPDLTASEVKDIILQSSDRTELKVVLPGTSGKNKNVVLFSSLSSTGGLVNAYNALLLAKKQSESKQ